MESNATPSEPALEAVRALAIERSSTAERVADGLRSLIIQGELPPGSPLREGALGQALGVSRNSLREAFRLLSREGLVTHQMHHGIVVKRLSEADVRDIYYAREALELLAIERSAGAPAERLAGLREALEQADAALERRAFKEVATYDLFFHQALVGLLDSARIDVFFKQLLAELRLAFAIPEDQQAFLAPFVAWNHRMCAMLERGERERCGREMRAYLAEAERVIRSFLRGEPTSVEGPPVSSHDGAP